jgi:hypothetical protein
MGSGYQLNKGLEQISGQPFPGFKIQGLRLTAFRGANLQELLVTKNLKLGISEK